MSFYKMERGWMDHEMFDEIPYSEREAWVWIIEAARWKDGIISVKDAPFPLMRGQLHFSVRFMAERFKWSTNRVLRFLEKLKNWNAIVVSTETGQNLITVCNYSKYQGSGDSSGDTNGDRVGDTCGDSSGDKEEEGLKKDKEKKKEPEFIQYDGNVIRFTESDWLKIRQKYDFTDKQLALLIDDRDSYLASLPELDPRRSRWWIPTMKWLEAEMAGIEMQRRVE